MSPVNESHPYGHGGQTRAQSDRFLSDYHRYFPCFILFIPISLILDGRTNKKLKTALDRGGYRRHTLAGWPLFLSFRLSEWRRLFQVSGFRYWLREPATECAPGLTSNRSQKILPLICRLESSPTTAWAVREPRCVCLLRAAGIGSSRLEHSRLRSRRASFRQATEREEAL